MVFRSSPDLDDILEIEESRQIVEMCLQRGANLNRILSDQHKSHADFDAHQINCTYYSALGCNDDAYLAARAIQFFAPGVPQVYYVGLLAGQNDQTGGATRQVKAGPSIATIIACKKWTRRFKHQSSSVSSNSSDLETSTRPLTANSECWILMTVASFWRGKRRTRCVGSMLI